MSPPQGGTIWTPWPACWHGPLRRMSRCVHSFGVRGRLRRSAMSRSFAACCWRDRWHRVRWMWCGTVREALLRLPCGMREVHHGMGCPGCGGWPIRCMHLHVTGECVRTFKLYGEVERFVQRAREGRWRAWPRDDAATGHRCVRAICPLLVSEGDWCGPGPAWTGAGRAAAVTSVAYGRRGRFAGLSGIVLAAHGSAVQAPWIRAGAQHHAMGRRTAMGHVAGAGVVAGGWGHPFGLGQMDACGRFAFCAAGG